MINRSFEWEYIDEQVLHVGAYQSSLVFGSQWLINRFFGWEYIDSSEPISY